MSIQLGGRWTNRRGMPRHDLLGIALLRSHLTEAERADVLTAIESDATRTHAPVSDAQIHAVIDRVAAVSATDDDIAAIRAELSRAGYRLAATA